VAGIVNDHPWPMENRPSTFWDIVIVGGGIIGSATAYHLMRADSRLAVAVIEPDPTYTRASTVLSLANVRVQFSLKENILISRHTLEVLKRFDEDTATDTASVRIAYRPEGNLFLWDRQGEAAARKSLDLQHSLGCPVQWWSPEQLQARFPLYDPRGLAGATFGSADGHIDPHAFLMGYRNKSISLGARYVQDRVTAVLTSPGRVTGVRLASGTDLTAKFVVNCAGAWAADLARTAGVALPVDPVKRQVFMVDPAQKPGDALPLTVLPSGLYWRSETGGRLVIGKSMEEDPVGVDFSWSEDRFMETIWPELAEAVPAFDTLKLIRGWAGLYAVNRLDGNAILGEWPELKGFFLANGFSGHGLQQAPAVGRYLAERMTGRTPVLDLSLFGPERILDNRPLVEAGLV